MKIENYKERVFSVILDLIQTKFDIHPEDLVIDEATFTPDGIIVIFRQYKGQSGWEPIKHTILTSELQIFLYLSTQPKF